MNSHTENNFQKQGLRFFVIPDCVYEKAKFLARCRQVSISPLIRELINKEFRNRKITNKFKGGEEAVQLRLPFAYLEQS